VDERTREIGIRKAVGATTHNILTRFLSETLILALSGGIIGLILSFLIVGICSFIPEVGALQYIGKPIIVPVIPIVTVIILLIISMLAGLFPARRAARLKPVECLRYE
jgi:putative ABC transport system permease protein